MAETVKTEGRNYTSAQVGSFENLDQYVPYKDGKLRGKLFLKDLLGLTGMEVSLNKLPAGKGVPFYHKHKHNEELYIFVKGTGQFQVDGDVIEVKEGTVIRVSPDGSRTWRNNSTEDLYYIVIQAAANGLTAWTVEDGIVEERKVEWNE